MNEVYLLCLAAAFAAFVGFLTLAFLAGIAGIASYASWAACVSGVATFIGLVFSLVLPLGTPITATYQLSPSQLELTQYRLIVTVDGIERQYQDAKTVLAATNALPVAAKVTRYQNAWGHKFDTTKEGRVTSPTVELIFYCAPELQQKRPSI